MMTNAQLATASLDDIVFDGRNRTYGAYELRNIYQRHVTRALVIGTAMCALLLAYPVLARLLAKPEVVATPVIVTLNPELIIIPPQPDIVPPPPAAKPPVQPPQPGTVRNLVPVVAADNKVTPEDKVPSQDELKDKKSGLITTDGEPDADPNIEDLRPTKVPGGGGTGETVVEKPYTYVEQMPELPGGGGQLAIVTAIQKAVKYPSLALRNGVEGKVFVSFTVSPKGDVTDVKIVKGLGSGLDEETMRAIKTLPQFIPGRQNGREVSVSFTVPVTYRIQ